MRKFESSQRKESNGPLDWLIRGVIGGGAVLAVYSVVGAETKADPTADGRTSDPPSIAFYWNCDAARAAGVAPLHVGEPGYRSELDADGDGIACEPYKPR